MLDVRESFVLCRGDDLAIVDETRRRVVIDGINSECIHLINLVLRDFF
jgi:hypothetical protein